MSRVPQIWTNTDKEGKGTTLLPVVNSEGQLIVEWGGDSDEYGINDIENASATITYVGKEDKDGNWLIVKIDTTTGYAISYATYLNNGTLAPNTYTHAWTDRATLTYGTFSAAI